MTTKKITQLCGIQKFFTIAMLLFLCLSLFGNTLHAATKNTTTYYHVNLQGTPIAASDESGAVKWSQSYSSYGYHGENTEQINDKGPTSFGFGSHVEDQYDDKLLVYMQGRYYDPALGRFLSVDPVGFNESNPASFNRYIYGNNNPHKYFDPDGELPLLLIYWGVSAALSAYDTYSAYQEGGIGAAAVQIALSTGGAGGKAALRGGKLLKRVVGAPASTVQANKAAGDAARDGIAARTGGTVEQNFRVTGGLRRVDVLTNGTAIESKVGKTSLTRRIRKELARDVKLLRSGQVDRVQWEFSRSSVTGKSGPTRPLREKLEKFGIDIVE